MLKMYTKKDLINDFEKAGVCKGDLLNVKCSLKSIGYQIDGGVKTLIEALLESIGEEGTIVTDSFISSVPMYKLKKDKSFISTDSSPSYAGALANAMIKFPKRYRSSHPIQRFVSIGRMAKWLTEGHQPESYAYDVLRVMAENGGKNLKIGTDEKVVGVGTTHVAIGELGFKQKRLDAGIWYYNENGQLQLFKRNWAGACHDGLINFLPFYSKNGGILSTGNIGKAECKITDMKKTLEMEISILKKDPSFFMCKSKFCTGCQLTWNFKKTNIGKFAFTLIANNKWREFKQVLKYFVMHYQPSATH